MAAAVQVRPAGLPSLRALGLTGAAIGAGLLALSPTVYGAAQRVMDGSWVSPPVYWRSSPSGVDLLALVAPNPSHPLVRALAGYEQETAPTVFIEYTAAIGLVVLAVIAVAVWRAGLRARGWFWAFGIFAALSLGPFVHVAGVNTYVPGPWALLRYVPIINLTRMPGRFAVVATLMAAVLFALALQALGARWPHRRRAMLALVAVALVAELLPTPRPLYPADIAAVYDVIRADPRDVRVLELPFGIRDGVSSEGNFSARYQFNQTRHGKRLLGGYLSRVSARRFVEVKRSPILAALVTLSAGRQPAGDLDAVAADGRRSWTASASAGW